LPLSLKPIPEGVVTVETAISDPAIPELDRIGISALLPVATVRHQPGLDRSLTKITTAEKRDLKDPFPKGVSSDPRDSVLRDRALPDPRDSVLRDRASSDPRDSVLRDNLVEEVATVAIPKVNPQVSERNSSNLPGDSNRTGD
jgi:hypothetical protein